MKSRIKKGVTGSSPVDPPGSDMAKLVDQLYKLDDTESVEVDVPEGVSVRTYRMRIMAALRYRESTRAEGYKLFTRTDKAKRKVILAWRAE